MISIVYLLIVLLRSIKMVKSATMIVAMMMIGAACAAQMPLSAAAPGAPAAAAKPKVHCSSNRNELNIFVWSLKLTIMLYLIIQAAAGGRRGRPKKGEAKKDE